MRQKSLLRHDTLMDLIGAPVAESVSPKTRGEIPRVLDVFLEPDVGHAEQLRIAHKTTANTPESTKESRTSGSRSLPFSSLKSSFSPKCRTEEARLRPEHRGLEVDLVLEILKSHVNAHIGIKELRTDLLLEHLCAPGVGLANSRSSSPLPEDRPSDVPTQSTLHVEGGSPCASSSLLRL